MYFFWEDKWVILSCLLIICALVWYGRQEVLRGGVRKARRKVKDGGYEIYLTDISRNSIKLLLLGQGSCYPNYLTQHKLSI
jgi:hypothetical protein